MTEMSAELWNSAARVLDTNWAGDHMVPSRRLYPHQWSWDAAFIAIGLAYVNPSRAWRDLRSLFEAQWPDGRVPHIVFDPATAEDDYFPGPGVLERAGLRRPGRPRQHRHRAAAAARGRRVGGLPARGGARRGLRAGGPHRAGVALPAAGGPAGAI